MHCAWVMGTCAGRYAVFGPTNGCQELLVHSNNADGVHWHPCSSWKYVLTLSI